MARTWSDWGRTTSKRKTPSKWDFGAVPRTWTDLEGRGATTFGSQPVYGPPYSLPRKTSTGAVPDLSYGKDRPENRAVYWPPNTLPGEMPTGPAPDFSYAGEIPTKGEEAPPQFTRFSWWRPQGGVAGLGWDPNFRLPVTGIDENAIEFSHFFNWFNQALPYLDPNSAASFADQLLSTVATLPPDQGRELANYLRPLALKLGQRRAWSIDPAQYWDRDRLRELQRVTSDYWASVAGENQEGNQRPLTEAESYAQNLIDTLSLLLGNPVRGTTGIWNADQPMSRRERNAYRDFLESRVQQLGGDNGQPWGQVLMALLAPTTSMPAVRGGWGNMPSAWNRSYLGNRAYGGYY